MHISDDIRLGGVYGPSASFSSSGNPAPMELGVGPVGRIFTYDIVPATAGAAVVAALQTTAGAANLTLTAGAGVTAAADAFGTTRYTLDVPRTVSLTSTGNISGVNFTITGYDTHGQVMTQTIAGPNNNTVLTTKAFKSVTRVAVDGAVGTNTSVGTGQALGLPVVVPDAGYIVKAGWAGVLAQDAGTFVAGDTTSPATASTGDVRGTYLPSSAPNGTRRLVFTIALSSAQVGPQATRLAAYGVPQV